MGKIPNTDFVTFPVLPASDVVPGGCSGYAISAKSQYKELAWKFLQYISSKEGQELFGTGGDSVPVLKECIEDPNSSWRKYRPELNLNHEAFVYNADDENVNYFNRIDPHKALAATNAVSGILWEMSYGYTTHGNPAAAIAFSKERVLVALA
jgi:ABC-type glycerol-3-phosphate transport system substrate-binding protein